MGGQKSKPRKDNKSIKSVQYIGKETPMQADGQFWTKNLKSGELQIQLNNKYFIKEDHILYNTIQYLVLLINQKNEKDRGKIPKAIEMNYFSSVQFILGKNKMEDQKCMICLEDYQIPENLEKQLGLSSESDIYQLQCSHRYHLGCLINMIGDKQWMKCPICSTIFGKMQGDQPQGTMKITFDGNMTCPGNPKGTIIINYHFNGGTRNGINFPGTSRTGYLPDTPEGRQVSLLLKQAFDRKLVFTIGRSVTTGLDNQIVWNGIHHKTSLNGGAAHFGYPDETYLKRVKEQLAFKGIHKPHQHPKKK